MIKGFSANKSMKEVLNIDSIKEILFEDRSKELFVDQLKFSRKNWEISTSIIKKKYKFVYEKRYIIENYLTRPYGY